MRSFIIAALAAFASAGKVHEFVAESNFICEMCQKAVKHAAKEQYDEIDALYELFPALETRINAFGNQQEIVDLTKPFATCQNMDLCEVENNYMDILMQQPQDLDSIVEFVNNNPESTWKAAKPIKFENASRQEVRKYMGTVVDPEWTIKMHSKTFGDVSNDNLPNDFDGREQWPECNDVINHVRDQSECGSCWAHGTTEALNDRKCISSGGSFQELLSVADTTACCDGDSCFSFGCNGGQVGTPWRWFMNTGVVSGGDYGNTEWCFAYTMPQCAHHVAPVAPMVDCGEITEVDPVCTATCPSNSTIDYASDKVKGLTSYAVRGINNIKTEMMTYGSITAAFTVYEDFETYESGVYYHQTGSSLGGHAIKCIGWGVDPTGLNYWLCVNSWNDTWGMDGLFKIKMGDCGIDDQMHAGLA